MNDMTFTNFIDTQIQRSDDPSPIRVLRKHQSFRDVKSRDKARRFLPPRTNSPFPDLKPSSSVNMGSSRYQDQLDGHSRERSSSAVRESSPIMKLSKVSSEVGTPASKGLAYRLNDQPNFLKTSARRDLLQVLNEQEDTSIQLPRLLDVPHHERVRNDIKNFEHNETKRTSWLFQESQIESKVKEKRVKQGKRGLAEYFKYIDGDHPKQVKQKRISAPSADISRSRQFSAGVFNSKRLVGTRHASEDKIRESRKKVQEFKEVFSPQKRQPKRSSQRQSDRSCLVTFNKDSEASFSVEQKDQSSFLGFVQQQARQTVSQESPKKKPMFDAKEEVKTRNTIFITRKVASEKEKKNCNIISSPEITLTADVRTNKTPNFGESRKDFRIFLQKIAGNENKRHESRKNLNASVDRSEGGANSGRAYPKIPQCFKIRPSSRRQLSLKKNESACMDTDQSFSFCDLSEHHNRSVISLKSQNTFLNRINSVNDTKLNLKENKSSMQLLPNSKTRSEKNMLLENIYKHQGRHIQQNSTFVLHSRDHNHQAF